MPSGDQSTNPARVPGHSGSQRALLSVTSARKRSGAERLATPSGSLEQLVQPSPASLPLQGTELAALSTPEASLERLVPLVDYLAAWKLLPNVSQWVLRTVENGYRIQFGAPPPPFNGVIPTLVGPEQALVMEQEVDTLLRPPHERESGFYSRYFIVPKKDGGLRPILDLHQLNRSVMPLKFKMLTLKQVMSQNRSDWFVTIDQKDAYFHVSILPTHRKFLSFAFGGKAYQYWVLPFGLALSPCTFKKCVDAALAPLRLQGIRILNCIVGWLILAQSEQLAIQHRDVVLAHMKELGLRLNTKKSVLSPLQRTTYLGMVWDSTTMQARMSPARIESILTSVSQSSLSLHNASDGRVPHRLGSGLWSGRHLTGHINCPGDAGRVSSTETLPPRPKRSPCVGAHRQHSGGLLYQPPGRSVFVPLVQAGAPDPCVVPGQTPLTESRLHSWVSQCGSRRPVETGAMGRGMDASPRGGTGPFLRRVNPLHPEGLSGGYSGLPRPSWWPVNGQTPLSYTFPPQCTEAEASGTISCPSMGPGCGVRSSL